jgi:hypothetical protein
MNNQGKKISATLIACLAIAAFGCSSGSSNGAGGTGGSMTTGSGGSMGGGTDKVLVPDDTGYVMDGDTGIMGAWYIYGDGLGMTGTPPGDCQAKGMHADSDCSTIMYAATKTLPGAGFPQDMSGKMCIKGTGAKVIPYMGAPDYSNIFGIGMGLDFNNSGSAKNPFDLTAKKITAFKFTLSGVPMGNLRVEFPTTETEMAGHDSYYASKAVKDGDFMVSMAPDSLSGTAANADLAPAFTQAAGTMQPDFNPAHVLGVQFHVPTNVTASVGVSGFCVSNLTAVVSP